MFHTREVDWSQYRQTQDMPNGTTVVVDTRTGDRRLMAQSPIPMEYTQITQPTQFQFPIFHDDAMDVQEDATDDHGDAMDDQDESDGYSTPDEDFGDENVVETVGVGRESPVTPERRFFTTPCGQTYWVDGDLYLYTNETVDIPIGYWCDRDQCVYLDDGSGDTTDDDEDDYDPPPTPPPMYEEGDSIQGSPAPMETNSENEQDNSSNVSPTPMDTNSENEEVDGEVIVMNLSQ